MIRFANMHFLHYRLQILTFRTVNRDCPCQRESVDLCCVGVQCMSSEKWRVCV